MKINFTDSEYTFIESFWSESNSSTGDNYGKLKVGNSEINIKRDVRGRYIDIFNSDLITLLLDKLKSFDIVGISSGYCKLTKYVKGDYFSPHTDHYESQTGIVGKTVVIQLSNAEDYIGGDLVVESKIQPRDLGSVCIFKSNEVHEITPILKGVRKSLVIFLHGQDIALKRSLI